VQRSRRSRPPPMDAHAWFCALLFARLRRAASAARDRLLAPLPIMVRTRSAARRAAIDLSALPEDLLFIVARHLLNMQIPAVLHLSLACKGICAQLGAVRAEAKARWELSLQLLRVTAFHPHHQLCGYGGDFFGVSVADAVKFEQGSTFFVSEFDARNLVVTREHGPFVVKYVTSEMGFEGAPTGMKYVYTPWNGFAEPKPSFRRLIGARGGEGGVMIGDRIRVA